MNKTPERRTVRKRGLPPLLEERAQAALPDLFLSHGDLSFQTFSFNR
jgi:hypothetical protein